MAKKVAGFLKLQVPAGAANPSPPIGPALGQRGLNIMAFCKDFNAKTSQMEKGSPIPVVDHDLPGQVLHLRDAHTRRCPTPQEGCQDRKRLEDSGPRQRRQGDQAQVGCREEMADLNCDTVESAMRMVEGSARVDGHPVGLITLATLSRPGVFEPLSILGSLLEEVGHRRGAHLEGRTCPGRS